MSTDARCRRGAGGANVGGSHPTRPVYDTKSGAALDPQAVAADRRKHLRALEEQKAIILVPHDFSLAGAKRIRSKWLDITPPAESR